ncbi:MAG: GNAT family N-acetyltransferase [Promethearchaeota archaeon]
MKKEMIISKIKEAHIPQMVKIWNQHYKFLTSTRKQHTVESMLEWYKKRHIENHEMFGLLEENKLCAFMFLKYEEKKLWIKMLAVDEKRQKKGYGSKLVKFASLESQNRDLLTEIKIDNLSAINFFYKNNFKIKKFRADQKEYVCLQNKES